MADWPGLPVRLVVAGNDPRQTDLSTLWSGSRVLSINQPTLPRRRPGPSWEG